MTRIRIAAAAAGLLLVVLSAAGTAIVLRARHAAEMENVKSLVLAVGYEVDEHRIRWIGAKSAPVVAQRPMYRPLGGQAVLDEIRRGR